MSLFIYNLITQAYFFGIKLAANWNEKARQWVKGREGLFEKLAHQIPAKRTVEQRLVWMHCASLGEFEQGRTVIEALKKKHPEILILLSFFSPSGFEIRKNYEHADWVVYLPADSKSNAKQFLDLVKPDLAIFVKYEFWYYFLCQLKYRKIPTLLVSAIFRPTQPFFKWYGSLHRKILGFFREILVQDENSKRLLWEINIKNVRVVGDSRVDRVLEIARNPIDLPLVKAFCGYANVLVFGSTWPADEAIILPILTHDSFKDWKFILVPHDVQPIHIQAIEKQLEVPYCLFSQLENTNLTTTRLLLVEKIGLLSSLYQFGKIAYIGGGFGKGIHNILEPAAFGLPVVFGPKYKKFEEAVLLLAKGGAFSIHGKADLWDVILALMLEENHSKAAFFVEDYCNAQAGATEKILIALVDCLPPARMFN